MHYIYIISALCMCECDMRDVEYDQSFGQGKIRDMCQGISSE